MPFCKTVYSCTKKKTTTAFRPRPTFQPFRTQPRPAVQPLGLQLQPGTSASGRSQPGTFPVPSSPCNFGLNYSSEDHSGSDVLNFISALFGRVLKKIEELAELTRTMIHKQDQLMLRNVQGNALDTVAMPEGFSLPLTTEQEINRLEVELVETEFRTKLVQHLTCIGGDSIASLSRKILKRRFSAELAKI